MNLKWIKVYVRPETVKLLEKNKGKNSIDIGLGNDVFGYDTKSIDNKNKEQVGLYH